jgi:hypothetical protein
MQHLAQIVERTPHPARSLKDVAAATLKRKKPAKGAPARGGAVKRSKPGPKLGDPAKDRRLKALQSAAPPSRDRSLSDRKQLAKQRVRRACDAVHRAIATVMDVIEQHTSDDAVTAVTPAGVCISSVEAQRALDVCTNVVNMLGGMRIRCEKVMSLGEACLQIPPRGPLPSRPGRGAGVHRVEPEADEPLDDFDGNGIEEDDEEDEDDEDELSEHESDDNFIASEDDDEEEEEVDEDGDEDEDDEDGEGEQVLTQK